MLPNKEFNKQNPSSFYNYANNIDLSDMIAGIHYFLVMPFPSTEAENPKNYDVQPLVLTFDKDNYYVF